MKLVAIFVISLTVRSIQACGTYIRPSNVREARWENWELPPYNADWWGFINLLGTREVSKVGTTDYPAAKHINYEEEPAWPKEWTDVGVGDPGAAAPKWAHLKEDVGQPSYCSLLPQKGNGNEWYLRWYYDRKRAKCRRFVYSGLGGNVNKFLSEASCKEACALPAKICCVPDKLFNYASYLNIQRRLIVNH